MNPERIRRTLSTYHAACIDAPSASRAAVAMIVRQSVAGSELLFIERATRDEDPWSGHMAFPGGRQHPEDPDLLHTALRETHEEVGIDLHVHGEVLGRLDELYAVARLSLLDLVISPFVCLVQGPSEPIPNRAEVQSAVWIPLSFFRTDAARAVHHRTIHGTTGEYPAYRYQGYTIWGLTHRILDQFLHLVAREGEVA